VFPYLFAGELLLLRVFVSRYTIIVGIVLFKVAAKQKLSLLLLDYDRLVNSAAPSSPPSPTLQYTLFYPVIKLPLIPYCSSQKALPKAIALFCWLSHSGFSRLIHLGIAYTDRGYLTAISNDFASRLNIRHYRSLLFTLQQMLCYSSVLGRAFQS